MQFVRQWRYALLGSVTAACVYTLSHHVDSLWDTPTPWIDRVGFPDFLDQYTDASAAAGLIHKAAYDVPARFGPGTASNFSSDLFPTRIVGDAFHPIHLDKSLIRIREGDPEVETMDGETFNPAILKMPEGMAEGWEYIVVARGPRVNRRDIWVPEAGRHAEENGLVAFPATLSNNGFIPSLSASTPRFLPIKTPRNNTSCGHWTFPFGPEDPRLYWTDEGRPAMSLSMNARAEGRCRSVGWVADLRSVWPELVDAMRGVDQGLAKPWRESDSTVQGEWQGVKELLHDGMPNFEKNWMGFFPGAGPDKSTSLPLYHYSLVPARILSPATEPTTDSLRYTLAPPSSKASCIADKFRTQLPDLGRIHHATPLYRFTLCGRREPGCVPSAGNTVMVGLGQVKYVHSGGQRYGRFFVMWNVTEPFEYLAVGPMIRWFDTPDAEIVYAMSLVFRPPTPTNRYDARMNRHVEARYGPTHGFLDDELFVTLGLRDNEMGSLKMWAGELVAGMAGC